MVPQVAEPPLPPTVTALAKAAQAVAHREGAPQDWTPNVLVEQHAHQNANKAQQAGCQIHPPIHDKDGNLQPHSPWMVHVILEDHRKKRKGKEVQIAHALAHTHLNYNVPTSNMLVTYGEARKSTYRLQAATEGTAYTVYTWARYGDVPAPIWHPDPSWHQLLHGRRVPRQGIETRGEHRHRHPLQPVPPEQHKLRSRKRQDASDRHGVPPPDDATHRRTWGTTRRALHHDIDRDQATWIDQGSVTIGVGWWLNTLNPQKLRKLAGPYILYPVPHGMDGHCPGLRPGTPLRAPLPPRPVPAIAPTTRPTPRCLPKHGNRCQRSIPHDGGHHGPTHPSRSGAPHGTGATTTQH